MSISTHLVSVATPKLSNFDRSKYSSFRGSRGRHAKNGCLTHRPSCTSHSTRSPCETERTPGDHALYYVDTITAPLYQRERPVVLISSCFSWGVLGALDRGRRSPSPVSWCLVYARKNRARARRHEAEMYKRRTRSCSVIPAFVDTLTRAGELTMDERSQGAEYRIQTDPITEHSHYPSVLFIRDLASGEVFDAGFLVSWSTQYDVGL